LILLGKVTGLGGGGGGEGAASAFWGSRLASFGCGAGNRRPSKNSGLGRARPAEELGALRAQDLDRCRQEAPCHNVLAIALANKLARFAWTVLAAAATSR
jgi:hypothetical protein